MCKMINCINKDEVEKYLRKWQDILRLRDWDIKLLIVETEWRKSGDIKIDLDDKKAVLLINKHPKSENAEELVVHELLHLKLYRMDMMTEDLFNIVYGENEDDPKRSFAYSQYMLTLESTVEDLTKGYLAVGGNDKELSFGRLDRELGAEIGNIVIPINL